MQYFTQKQDDVDIDKTRFQTISKATYSDSLVWEKIKEKDVDKLFACSVQMAVVGYGNKDLGEVLFDGAEIAVKDYLESVDVNCEMISGAALKEDILTPRRLIRAFRFHIQEYLQSEGVETYLFKKYNSDAGDSSYIFPGAEYLITDSDNAADLLLAYENLDNRQNTNVHKRAIQVFTARGIVYNEE